jgi:type II secretory pathway component PulF
MPTFTYRAADVAGQLVDGLIDGESEADALHALEQRALTTLTLRQTRASRDAETGRKATTRIRLPLFQLLEFTRELKVMLESGVTLLATLGVLRQSATGDYRRLLDRIAADIQRGAALSEALAAHPRTFDPFYIGTVRAGEAGGVHTEAMEELVTHYERGAAIKREILGALMYPAIVLLALLGACVVMLVWVVPQFKELFASLGGQLPLATRVLLFASDAVMQNAGLLLVGLAVAAATAWLLAPQPAVRSALGHLAGRLPFLGGIIYLSTVVQFSRMTALLERAGLPLLETLKIVENALLAGPVRRLTVTIRREVAGGSSIAVAASETKVLPDLVEHMISVGEATGRIDETLNAVATHYEEQMRVKIRRLATALEPLLTLLLCGLVLTVALAIFLPIWEMNSLMLQK